MIFVLQIFNNLNIKLSSEMIIIGLIVSTVLLWLIGYINDITKYYTYLDNEFYRRSNIFQKLEKMDTNK